MHGLINGISPSPAALPQAAASNAAGGGAGFQLSALTGNTVMARGFTPVASSPLGTQTVSTLLQTQDLSQTQIRGGHGGGGHHGGGKMTPGLEAEEVAESQEAQTLSPRKKLAQSNKLVNGQEIDEANESEEVAEGKTDSQKNKTSS